jgi:predicted transcriptional regulator
MDDNKILAENKLILLYILSKINLPISNQQFTTYILENKFINYFSLQEYINEILDNKLIENIIFENKNCYVITDKGLEVLTFFTKHIPDIIKQQIDSSLSSIKSLIKNELSITSDYITESENTFQVQCKIKENNFSLIDLSISVGTKKDSINICSNWKKHTQEIYNEIISALTKKRSL